MKNREKYRAQAEALVTQMTIEEAAGQLLHSAPAIERLNVPEYNWWNEALHGLARAGIATVFPQAIGMGATFDPAFMKAEGEVVSTEARAKYNAAVKHGDRDIYKGLTLWSPNINIFRDPHWGRGHETYGEDPTLTKHMGNAYIVGLQGDGEYLKTSACAKHYAVHSGPEALRHHFNAETTEKDLFETYLPAFESAVRDADVESIMGAYNAINGEPACGNERLLQEILRREWGYEGHMVSDCWAVKDFHEGHHFTSRGAESASRAVKMGCDVNCGCTYDRLLEGLEEGLITEEEIRESAIRAFTARFALGLFADDCEYDAIPYTACNTKENRLMARRAAEESMVLLKNDGVLPLNRDSIKTIGVIGPNAYSNAALYGNYYGDSDNYVTDLDGIRNAAGENIRVMYSKGIPLNKMSDDGLAKQGKYFSEAESVIEYSDVVMICLGLDETLEGEEGDAGNQDASGDKKDLFLPRSQRKLLERLLPCDKPVVIVLNSGSALDLSAYEKDVNAIIQAWYPGEEGGNALGEILFGDVNPSGKLPLTFYYNDQPMPEFTDYHMAGRTYKFVEAKPWYPFGYGLSYTCFAVNDVGAEVCDASDASDGAISIELPKSGPADDRILKVSASVSNTGTVAGTEVLQIYSRYEGEAFEKPHHKLIAFERVELAAGESRKITLNVPVKELYLIGEDGKAYLPDGEYTVFVGGCQPDERSVELYGVAPKAIGLTVARKENSSGDAGASNGEILVKGMIKADVYIYPDQESYIAKGAAGEAKYSVDTAINELYSVVECRTVLEDELPFMFALGAQNLAQLKSLPMSLADIVGMSGGMIPADKVTAINERLKTIK